MKYITEMFLYINYFKKKFNIKTQTFNPYYTAIEGVKKYCEDNDVNLDDRNEIEDYIISLNVPNIKINIFNLLYPNVKHNVTDERVQKCDLSMLSDSILLKYLFIIFSTINFVYKDNLIGLKYNAVIWTTGFHNLAKLCRGKVIDIETMTIVSYPFDKFFNVNEVSETKEDIIKKLVSESTYVYTTDKKDGSTIIVSLYKNKPLITTNGSFENDQIVLAEQLLKKKYPKFLKEIKEGYTYIFELIHPENRIVINYGNEKSLYLLAVRDLRTEKLLSLDETHIIANDFDFPVPQTFSFKNLSDILYLAHTERNTNREGWVLRIGQKDGGEFMLKIKLDEYFELHSAFSKITLTFVYRHLLANDLDDIISIVSENQQKEIKEYIKEIENIREKIKENSENLTENICKKFATSLIVARTDRELTVKIISEIIKEESLYGSFAIEYLKYGDSVEDKIRKIPTKIFKKFVEVLNEKV